VAVSFVSLLARLAAMATANDEEVPTLPLRSASRELIPGAHAPAGNQIKVFALIGGVALAFIGAGAAYQAGVFSATPAPTVPPIAPAERQHEFLDAHKHADVHKAHEARADMSAKAVEVRNATHQAAAHKGHAQMTCQGGSLAACQCLFACEIFGGQPSQCDGSKSKLLDSLIQKALATSSDACRGMQCIVQCAKSLQCYDEHVQNDCRALQKRAKELELDDSTCEYECEKERGTSAASVLHE